jgi:hypothetical protein
MAFTGCEGPAGPAGEDANETCKQCHNESTDLFAQQQYQYDASMHAQGGHSERADRGTCALCHSHEGFMEYLSEGKDPEAVTSQPGATQPQCRTCHMIHTNYDTTDYQIRTTEAVALWINDETVDFGKGNMCTNCHQPRVPDPMPTVGGGSVTITSPYWGIHHGPQSAILAGTAAFDFGTELTGGHPHANAQDGCVSCHMAEGFGQQSGGHTMKASYENYGSTTYNTNGCTDCHNDEDALITKIEDTKTEIETLHTNLLNLLVSEGILSESGGINVSFGSSIELTEEQAGALLNYKFVEEDKSGGVHNPTYTKAILEASIAAIQ